MVGASKILTVSYGTFSCTLEGFDEPFSTMKAIAEYFRDLAADDRYFGAEPPTPDAEMLHRIAEREIQRRVETKIQANGVILRAQEVNDAAPADAARGEAPGEEAPRAIAPTAAAVSATAQAPESPVAPASAPLVLHAAPAAIATPAQAAPAEPMRAAEPVRAAEPAPALAATELPAAEASSAPAMLAAEEDTDDAFEGEAVEADVIAPHNLDNSVAAKLQRIRAAVADARAAALAETRADVPAEADAAATLAAVELAPAIVAAPEAPLVAEPEAAAEPLTEATVMTETAEADFGFALDADLPAAGEEAVATEAEALAPSDVPEVFDDEAEETALDPWDMPLAAENIAAAQLASDAEDEGADTDEVEAILARLSGAGEVQSAEDHDAAELEDAAATDAASDLCDSETAAPEGAEAETADADIDLADTTVAALAEIEPEEAEAPAPQPQEAALDDDAAILAALAGLDVAAKPAAEDREVAEAAPETAPETEPVSAMPVMQTEATAQTEAASVPRRARVIKVRRNPDVDLAALAQDLAKPAAPLVQEDAQQAPTEVIEAEVAAEVTPDATPEVALEPDLRAIVEPVLDLSDSGLSAEDEAELLRELAALQDEDAEAAEDVRPEALLLQAEAEAEEILAAEPQREAARDPIVLPEAARVAPASAVPAVPSRPQERHAASARAEPAESDLSRLIKETNSKLEVPENRRRLSAIAHLKAAVAATVADRKLRFGRQETPEESQERAIDPYREDLTQAVRPRRPVSASAPEGLSRRPTAPEAARPTPLMLVSEQRVDHEPTSVPRDTPVIRPRRITGADLPLRIDESEEEEDVPLSPAEARSFAEFAERLGAEALPDLLEAAAAYTAAVEGRPHFSRPQIIRKLDAVAEDENYSREDSLRSFGMLLRQGKIAKVRRGQFEITQQSRYFGASKRA